MALLATDYCKIAEHHSTISPLVLRGAFDFFSVGEGGSGTVCIGNTYTVHLGHVSSVALRVLAAVALDQFQFRDQPKIVTRSALFYRKKSRGRIEDHCDVVIQKYALADRGICSVSLSEEDFQRLSHSSGTTLVLNSYNSLPSEPVEIDSVRYFETAIQKTLPYLPDLVRMGWRCEEIGRCQTEQIALATKVLMGKGFCVDLQPPYVQVVPDGESWVLVPRQSLSVKIPLEAISHKVVQKGRDSYDDDDFTVDSVMREWEALEDKLPLPPTGAPLSADDVIALIGRELAIVARNGGLAQRYAFDISRLDGQEQRELVKELRKLGYSQVLIDERFIDLQAPGFVKQYVYIDLRDILLP